MEGKYEDKSPKQVLEFHGFEPERVGRFLVGNTIVFVGKNSDDELMVVSGDGSVWEITRKQFVEEYKDISKSGKEIMDYFDDWVFSE